MSQIAITVDGRSISTTAGVSVLAACLDNGMYIPNLCWLKEDLQPETSCRLCFVAIEGQAAPVTACSTPVVEGMTVFTSTPEVRRLQKAAFSLLLSIHDVTCKTCPANRACELQRIARFLKVGLKSRDLETVLKTPDVVREHPQLDYYPNHCVLCGRCIRVCRNHNERPVLTYIKRGLDTTVGFFNAALTQADACRDCLRCTAVCPVKALLMKPSA